VNIKQIGHAIFRIKKYGEEYLIPLPDVKVSGLLTGTAYPELTGTYEIVSTSGLVSEIDFSGKRVLGLRGSKNHVSAAVYNMKDRKKALYTVEGSWSDKFTIRDEIAGKDIETFDCTAAQPAPIKTAPLEQQDPWESRRAWKGTIDALNDGQMQAAANEKLKIEEGQRAMRKEEEAGGKVWQPIFFSKTDHDARYEKLSALKQEKKSLETGLWVWDREMAERARRPFHGELTPANVQA
jgi:hypothetical protein